MKVTNMLLIRSSLFLIAIIGFLLTSNNANATTTNTELLSLENIPNSNDLFATKQLITKPVVVQLKSDVYYYTSSNPIDEYQYYFIEVWEGQTLDISIEIDKAYASSYPFTIYAKKGSIPDINSNDRYINCYSGTCRATINYYSYTKYYIGVRNTKSSSIKYSIKVSVYETYPSYNYESDYSGFAVSFGVPIYVFVFVTAILFIAVVVQVRRNGKKLIELENQNKAITTTAVINNNLPVEATLPNSFNGTINNNDHVNEMESNDQTYYRPNTQL
ncbi:hypothetical protein ABK040_008625 [Willaertia magna]